MIAKIITNKKQKTIKLSKNNDWGKRLGVTVIERIKKIKKLKI